MSGAEERSALDELVRAVVGSVPASPGMTAAVGSGSISDALAGELRRRGLSVTSAGAADVVFVADDTTSEALGRALSRCRDRGLVVYVGSGPLDRLDLYPEVHSRGLRLTFRTLDTFDTLGATPTASGPS